MPTFNSFNNNPQQEVVQEYDFTNKQTKGLFLTKVFGVMFLCLLITTVVAAGLGYGFQALLIHSVNNGASIDFSNNLVLVMIGMLIVSAIALLVMSFVLPITFIRGKHNILVPLIIYVVLMGVLLSSFTWMFEPLILVEGFGITTLIFGVMALLGYLSKGRVAGLGVILLGLLIGAGLLALFNFLSILFGGISQANVTISWIVSFAIFAFLMLLTMWDVARISQIAEKGMNSGNSLIYYCAYILYSDFISILIRVIYYLAIITSKK